jgi:hypothetical protein
LQVDFKERESEFDEKIHLMVTNSFTVLNLTYNTILPILHLRASGGDSASYDFAVKMLKWKTLRYREGFSELILL